MNCLGIESTAHTFGIGIINGKGKILANETSYYKPKAGSGIIPTEAAEHHRKNAPLILKKALEEANLTINDIDFIALAAGPGLPPCLMEGKKFAESLKKPVLSVNHCVAHIEISKLTTKSKDPLIVYTSGGNTQIIAHIADYYRVFGETLDIGIGNAIDKFARELNLEMPGGYYVEKLALDGKKYVSLPYTVKGMDMTFSGLVTAASKLKNKHSKEDLCYSFQETILSMLCEVTERALAHTEKKEMVLTGGVAQNKRLQEMLAEICKEHKVKFYATKNEYCGDNGLMIAWTGILAQKQGIKPGIRITPKWRTDTVEWKI